MGERQKKLTNMNPRIKPIACTDIRRSISGAQVAVDRTRPSARSFRRGEGGAGRQFRACAHSLADLPAKPHGREPRTGLQAALGAATGKEFFVPWLCRAEGLREQGGRKRKRILLFVFVVFVKGTGGSVGVRTLTRGFGSRSHRESVRPRMSGLGGR